MAPKQHPLVEQLFRYAAKLRVPEADRWDVAYGAYLDALEAGVPEWKYASTCLLHRYTAMHRKQYRRERQYTILDGSAEAVEMLRLYCSGGQYEACLLGEVGKAIGDMSLPAQAVMRLVAREFTPAEISTRLDMPLSEVQWRMGLARKQLTKRGYKDEASRGHSTFVGIRRRGQKWTAEIKKGGKFWHLGNFDTASDAAKAYDAAAKEMNGSKARLNFPQSEAA